MCRISLNSATGYGTNQIVIKNTQGSANPEEKAAEAMLHKASSSTQAILREMQPEQQNTRQKNPNMHQEY